MAFKSILCGQCNHHRKYENGTTSYEVARSSSKKCDVAEKRRKDKVYACEQHNWSQYTESRISTEHIMQKSGQKMQRQLFANNGENSQKDSQ